MIPGHHIIRRLFYLLPTTLLSAVLGATTVAAADAGYPPPPGPYRSASPAPQPAPPAAGQASSHPVDTGARPSRSTSGMLPLPDDTYSASETADILFGSVPTLPPSAADPKPPTATVGASPSPERAPQDAAAAAATGREQSSMKLGRDMRPSMVTGPGIPDNRHYPPRAIAYPGYQPPAPPYYPGYQGPTRQFERPLTSDPLSGGYETSYRTPDSHVMPSSPDPVREDVLEPYAAPSDRQDLPGQPPTGAAETTADELFRPLE